MFFSGLLTSTPVQFCKVLFAVRFEYVVILIGSLLCSYHSCPTMISSTFLIKKKKGFSQKKKKTKKKKHSPSHFDIRKTQHASLVLLTVVLCKKKTNKSKTKKRCGTKT